MGTFRYEYVKHGLEPHRGDFDEWVFVFSKTPLESIGKPDRPHREQEERIRVIVTGYLKLIWCGQGMAEEDVWKAAFFYAVERGIKGRNEDVRLDPLYDPALKLPVAVCDVSFGAFDFEIPTPKMGFRRA